MRQKLSTSLGVVRRRNVRLCMAIAYLDMASVLIAGTAIIELMTKHFRERTFIVIGCTEGIGSALGFFAGTVVGRLSDESYFGRRRTLLGLWILASIPILIAAVVKSAPLYAVSIGIAAACAIRNPGGINIVLNAWITDWADEDERAATIVVAQIGFHVYSLLIAPIICVSFAQEWLTLPMVLNISIAIRAVGLGLIWKLFPARTKPPDEATSKLLPSAAVNMTILGSVKHQLVVFGRTWKWLWFASPGMVFLAIMHYVPSEGMGTSTGSFFRQQLDFTPADLNLTLTLFGAGSLLYQLLFLPLLLASLGSYYWVMVFEMFCSALNYLILSVTNSKMLIFQTSMLAVIGAAGGPVITAMMADIVSRQPDGQRGAAMGALNSFKLLGHALGPLLFGLPFECHDRLPPPLNQKRLGIYMFAFLSVVGCVGAGCLAVYERKRGKSARRMSDGIVYRSDVEEFPQRSEADLR